MYLLGDRVKFPSSQGKETCGTVLLIEEQLDFSYSYVIDSDDVGIVIRNSEDDSEMSLLNNPVLDFL